MQVNGNQFKTYIVDTIDDVLKRIAAEMQTLPKFLLFPDGKPTSIENLDNVVVNDYLSQIRGKSTCFNAIPAPYPSDVEQSELYKIYIASNTALNKDYERVKIILNTLTRKLQTTLGSFDLDLSQYWTSREQIMKNLDYEIATLQKEVRQTHKKHEYMDNVASVDATDHEIDNVVFSVEMGQYDGTIYDLFDSIVPSIWVPFAKCTTDGDEFVFKIYQEIKVRQSWLDYKLNNGIMLRVNPTREHQSDINYTKVIFLIDDKNTLHASFDTVVSSSTRVPYLSRDEFTARVLQVFKGLKNQITLSTDYIITSRFTIPLQCFDASIFADFIMTNKNVSNIVVIDEFVNVSRVQNTSCYVKLVNKPTSAVTLTLSESQMKPGEWYIMCRTRTQTSDDIIPLKKIILKVFHMYKENEKQIADEYRRYLKTFRLVQCTKDVKVPKQKKRVGRKGIASIEPDMFVNNYSRLCMAQPTIIDNESEAVDDEGNPLQIMKFPINGEVRPDGTPFQQRMYFCNVHKPTTGQIYTYPGLRSNTLHNQDTFKYLPCCHLTDQRGTKAYGEYFRGEQQPIIEREFNDGPVIIRDTETADNTDIVADNTSDDNQMSSFINKTGPAFGELEALPDILVKFFSIVDDNPLHEYRRCGMRRTRFSSIEAVMFAENRINKDMRTKIIEAKVTTKLNELLKNIEKYATSAKQEIYNKTVDEIKNDILDKKTCLIPSKYIHLIETLMNCQIYIFKESGLYVPEHSKLYLKYLPVKQTILMYEHSGNIVELIGHKEVMKAKSTFNKGFFDPESKIIANIDTFLRKLSVSYYKQIDTDVVCKIPAIKPLSSSKFNVTGQVLDNHGKCRMFVIDDKFSFVPAIPIPPHAALLIKALPRTTIEQVKQTFRKRMKILWKKCTDSGVCREIVVSFYDKSYTILVNDTNHETTTSNRIAQHSNPPMYEDVEGDSIILKYQHEKKQAYDLLSNTIKRLLAPNDARSQLDTVMREHAETIGGLANEQNIRLLYACKQWILTHKPDTVMSTSPILNAIPLTYTLNGIESVENLMKTYVQNYDTVYKYPRLNNTNPYFFKCNDILYLAIPAKEGLDMANQMIYSWITTKSPHQLTTSAKYTFKVMVFDSPDKLIEITTLVNPDDRQLNELHERGMILYIHNEDRYDALLQL